MTAFVNSFFIARQADLTQLHTLAKRESWKVRWSTFRSKLIYGLPELNFRKLIWVPFSDPPDLRQLSVKVVSGLSDRSVVGLLRLASHLAGGCLSKIEDGRRHCVVLGHHRVVGHLIGWFLVQGRHYLTNIGRKLRHHLSVMVVDLRHCSSPLREHR